MFHWYSLGWPRAEALPGDLLWQKEALLKAARKAIIGCDERAWPAAAPAACALAVALEGILLHHMLWPLHLMSPAQDGTAGKVE